MNRMLLEKDFINECSALTLQNIQNLIDSKEYDRIGFTKFINDKDSVFYNRLNYTGCMTKEQQEIMLNTYDYRIFEKKVYTAVNEEFIKYLQQNNIDEIDICGFDTDACVQKTALDLFEQGYNVFVLKDYCMCSEGKELDNTIIDNLRRLIGNDSIK